MQFIVAVDEAWGIGRNGGMLGHFPKDLAFFKQKTTGHVVVMGRKTLESFPGGKPLPNRLHIVLTRNANYIAPEGVILVHSLKELQSTLKKLDRDDIFLVGGGSMYNKLLPYCEGGYVTHIGHHYEGVEVYFPRLPEYHEWVQDEAIDEIEDHGIILHFYHYKNKQIKSLEELADE